MVPEDFRYTATHEWCTLEDDVATIGLTEHALTDVGKLVCVELPEVGADILVEVPFGEIEGVKATRDLMPPFDGAVAEVNTRVLHDPDLLETDPYKEGWLIRLKIERAASLDHLLSAAAYQQLVGRRRR